MVNSMSFYSIQLLHIQRSAGGYVIKLFYNHILFAENFIRFIMYRFLALAAWYLFLFF